MPFPGARRHAAVKSLTSDVDLQPPRQHDGLVADRGGGIDVLDVERGIDGRCQGEVVVALNDVLDALDRESQHPRVTPEVRGNVRSRPTDTPVVIVPAEGPSRPADPNAVELVDHVPARRCDTEPKEGADPDRQAVAPAGRVVHPDILRSGEGGGILIAPACRPSSMICRILLLVS